MIRIKPKYIFKLTGIVLLILSCLPLQTNAQNLLPYQSKSAFPEFSLPDLKNKLHKFSDYRGKVVLVNFWASWCPSCVYELPGMKRLKEKMTGRPFEILTINVGEPRFKVWKFLKVINFNLITLMDTNSEVFNQWSATVLPTSFLIDHEGQVHYRIQGSMQWDSVESISTIEKLLIKVE